MVKRPTNGIPSKCLAIEEGEAVLHCLVLFIIDFVTLVSVVRRDEYLLDVCIVKGNRIILLMGLSPSVSFCARATYYGILSPVMFWQILRWLV